MSKSTIEWPRATEIIDRGGRRTRIYIRKRPGTPGARQRREMAAEGLAWCRGCEAWIAAADVRRGACRGHHSAEARQRYAACPDYRSERRAHTYFRKFGVLPVPMEGKEALSDFFDGECAYCEASATTWDHVVPVSNGGLTEPGNILPACSSCNSSKKGSDLFSWIDATGRILKLKALERLAHYQVGL